MKLKDLAFYFLIIILSVVAINGFYIDDSIVVSGASMEPTYHDGDVIKASDVKNVHNHTNIEVGDVVVFNLSSEYLIDENENLYEHEGTLIIKRVEKIEDVDGDGEMEYFLSGDNVGNSFDSSFIDPNTGEDLGFGWVEAEGILKIVEE